MRDAECRVVRYHDGMCARSRRAPLAHPCDVARLSHTFATRMYPDGADDEDYDPGDVAYGAGLMVYGCELYGLTFEQVSDHVGPFSAQVVAVLSSDNRLLSESRFQRQCEAIAGGSLIAKAVKLAEVIASSRDAMRVPDEQLVANRVDVHRWYDNQRRILAVALTDLREVAVVREPVDVADCLIDKVKDRIYRVVGRPRG